MKKFINRITNYIKDSYNELVYKVSWPTQAELTSSAVIVMFASVIMAAVVFGVDSAFKFIVTSLYGIF